MKRKLLLTSVIFLLACTSANAMSPIAYQYYLSANYYLTIKQTDKAIEELKKAISESIKAKQSNLVGSMASQGTTPRQLTDLIGSLCDLTSGSGDKGTPIILIQGYFDNYTN